MNHRYAPLIAVALLTGGAVSGCARTVTTAAAPAAAPASAPALPSCQAQLTTWRGSNARPQLNAVVADFTTLGKALSALGTALENRQPASTDESTVQTASASLQSDSQTAQDNLPPACIPGARTDESAALNDAAKAAINSEDAVGEVSSGNDTAATGDFDATLKDINTGFAQFTAAGNAVAKFDPDNP